MVHDTRSPLFRCGSTRTERSPQNHTTCVQRSNGTQHIIRCRGRQDRRWSACSQPPSQNSMKTRFFGYSRFFSPSSTPLRQELTLVTVLWSSSFVDAFSVPCDLTTQTLSRRKQDRLAASRRVALSRVMSVFLVASTTASCLLLQRSGLVDLALGRMTVAFLGVLWFASTFTEVGC